MPSQPRECDVELKGDLVIFWSGMITQRLSAGESDGLVQNPSAACILAGWWVQHGS